MHSKGNNKQDKKTTLRWEKIIANITTDKGLISKIYMHLIQLNIEKTDSPIKKMGKKKPNFFFQIRYTDGSISLIVREMQIKTTMRYHLT